MTAPYSLNIIGLKGIKNYTQVIIDDSQLKDNQMH